MRVYISGPMTGYKDYNYPAFHRVADEWRKLGHDVFCPAENFKGSTDLPWEFYMKEDLRLVMHCDAIVMLHGWDLSRGALMEALVAKTCGLHMFTEEGIELNFGLGLLGNYLKEWEYEHSYIRENEVWQVNPDTGVIESDAGCESAELSWTTQAGSSDSGLGAEEPGDSTGLGSVGVRPRPGTVPNTTPARVWLSEPAGIPVPE